MSRQGTIVGPLILIMLGGIFLGINFGWLPPDIWAELGRFWPVLLILIGIELLTGRSGSVVVRLLGHLAVVAVLAGVVAFVWLGRGNAVGSAADEKAIHVPLEGATMAELMLELGPGSLHLLATPDDRPTDAVRGTARGYGAENVAPDILSRTNDMVIVDLSYPQAREGNFLPVPFDLGWHKLDWRLELAKGILFKLKADTGVGETDLDLSDLRVVVLDLNTGVGTTDLTLPKKGKVKADVNAGVGELRLVVPAGVGARISVNRGLGGLDVADRFASKAKDVFETANYTSAADQIDMTVHAGVGGVTIR